MLNTRSYPEACYCGADPISLVLALKWDESEAHQHLRSTAACTLETEGIAHFHPKASSYTEVGPPVVQSERQVTGAA